MKHFLSKRKKQSIRPYRSLEELPVWNWHKAKQGDLRYILRLDDYDTLPDVEVRQEDWESIEQEFFNKFGKSGTGGYYFDKFIELQRAIRDMIVYTCDESPKLSKTKVKIAQLEKELEQVPEAQTLEEQAVTMEVFFNRDFDVRRMSTYKWFTYINEYERRIAEIKKAETN